MNRDSRVVEIELEKIVPNRFQPRKSFNEDINELAESIRVHGVLQPITVRQLGEKYEIVMGERRYRACEKLGMRKIPCMIVEMNDREAMEVALIENLQRQDLTPIEEALSYKRILEAGYITQDQLAQRLGKNQSTIANKLRLLSLSKEVQEALLKKQISERHARSLLTLKKELQPKLLKKIIEERLTVKRTEEEIYKMENESHETTDNAIEIIDFDDNPFRDPIPVSEDKVPSSPENDNFESDVLNGTIDEFSDEPSLEESKLEFEIPKPKTIIPSLGIIDDFETENKAVTEEINHKVPEKIEDINLDNIEPDEIDLESIKPAIIEETVKSSSTKEDFNQIKNIIDKCKNDIESLGYKIEFEKIDFETMYQIILKIYK